MIETNTIHVYWSLLKRSKDNFAEKKLNIKGGIIEMTLSIKWLNKTSPLSLSVLAWKKKNPLAESSPIFRNAENSIAKVETDAKMPYSAGDKARV